MKCGADFGKLNISHTDTASVALGVLLAGGTYQGYSAALEYSDTSAISSGAFNEAQHKVLPHIDRLFEEYRLRNNEELRADPARPKTSVKKEKVYFLKWKEQLVERMDTEFGKEVGYNEGVLSWPYVGGCRLFFTCRRGPYVVR